MLYVVYGYAVLVGYLLLAVCVVMLYWLALCCYAVLVGVCCYVVLLAVC